MSSALQKVSDPVAGDWESLYKWFRGTLNNLIAVADAWEQTLSAKRSKNTIKRSRSLSPPIKFCNFTKKSRRDNGSLIEGSDSVRTENSEIINDETDSVSEDQMFDEDFRKKVNMRHEHLQVKERNFGLGEADDLMLDSVDIRDFDVDAHQTNAMMKSPPLITKTSRNCAKKISAHSGTSPPPSITENRSVFTSIFSRNESFAEECEILAADSDENSTIDSEISSSVEDDLPIDDLFVTIRDAHPASKNKHNKTPEFSPNYRMTALSNRGIPRIVSDVTYKLGRTRKIGDNKWEIDLR